MISQNSIDDTIEENDFSVNRSGAGVTVVSSVNHSDNSNTDSNAQQLIKSGGASGGDPYTRYLISGTQEFSVGIDNTDSDKLKIGPNAHPSTGTASISVKPAGDVTFNGAYEFPTADGSTGQTLVTDGTGNVDWGSTAGSGEILQIRYAQTSSIFNISSFIPADGSIPQSNEGQQILSLSITPKIATSFLLIQFSGWGLASAATTGAQGAFSLFRDSGTNAIYATMCVSSGAFDKAGGGQATGFIRISAGSTTLTTFKLRAGPCNTASSSSFAINRTIQTGGNCFGGVQITSMTITEIAV
jgi:hypothetical protein